jgi:transcriptional regulator with XRE-family HTH domain
MRDGTPRQRRRGGLGGAEPKAIIVEREATVWEWSCRGLRQRAIAERVGISQAAVSKILRRVQRRVEARMAETHARMEAQHVDRLEHLLAAALDGWEASRTDRTRRRQRRVEGSAGSEAQDRMAAEIVVETRAGDARLLREARETIALLMTIAPPVPPSADAPAPSAERLRTLSDEELTVIKKLVGESHSQRPGARSDS